MQPEFAGCVYVPEDQFTLHLSKALTVQNYNLGTDEIVPIEVWERESRPGYVGIPRKFGYDYFKGQVEDCTSGGHAIPEGSLKPITLRPAQEPWVDGIIRAMDTHYDFRAKAHTGFGKTIASLELIRRLGTTTLVLVDQTFLRDQWAKKAEEFLACPKDRIGFIQGKQADYAGKWIVIGMVQTLFSRRLPDDFYDHFGLVIADEVHTVGAPQFSKVLLQLNANTRLGISATPNRRDALESVLDFNLGAVEVEATQQHKPSMVRYLEYPGAYSPYANTSKKMGRFINEVAAETRRNYLICDAIKWLYDNGRRILVVSDRVEHLEYLYHACCFILPAEEMGVVGGTTNTWCLAKDPKPARRPAGWEKGTEYSPVALQRVAKRTPKRVLEERKNSCAIVFATYGMFTKGVDVPSLSAGLDATPRSQSQQVHGRILRQQAEKKIPIWVTIVDTLSYRAQFQFSKRIKEYGKSNAEIYEWQLGKGVRKQDAKGLLARTEQTVTSLKIQTKTKMYRAATPVGGNAISTRRRTGTKR